MGVCGCMEFMPDYKMRGPGDLWYAIQIYHACSYCITPMGIIVHEVTPEGAKTWELEGIPELELQDCDTGLRDACIGIIDVQEVARQLDFEDSEVDVYIALSSSKPEREGQS